MSATDHGSAHSEPRLDPRGVRFSAAITTVVLALVLLSGSGVLVTAQAVVFAVASFAGMRFAPYGVVYRHLVAPRLGPPAEREDAARSASRRPSGWCSPPSRRSATCPD